jgi:hypothetical protein
VFCDNGFDTLSIATLDTLHIFAHRIPKKFLFFEYGTKAIEIEAYTTSPYSNIIYSNTIKIHIVPNSGGSVGTASSINQLAQLSVQPLDTYFFELAYPITLATDNDTVQVYNSSTTDAVNILILGDKEA